MRNINSTMVISSVQKLFCCTEKPINNNNKIGMGCIWIRAHLSFAILRAALLCARGSRTKWRNLGIIDGASLPIATVD